MIKVVICDGDGTLELPNPSTEIRNLVEALPSLGMKLAVASNDRKSSIVRHFYHAGLPLPEFIVTREDIGTPKPSPSFVYKIQELAGVQLNEMIYIGDDDNTDIFCAINARILPVAAKYSKSNKPMNYGLPIESPKAVLEYLSIFGRQETPYFSWSCIKSCRDTGSHIDIHALLGDHGGLTSILKTVLKDQKDVKIGPRKTSVKDLLFLYLVSQSYLSGLIANVDLVAVYPGHKKGSLNSTLEEYSKKMTLIFRERFIPDLILRHRDSPKSQYQKAQRNIFDQFRTIMINLEYTEKIRSKRILVLDDFTTYGYSLETARRMLLQSGVEHVVCLTIAKFRNSYSATRISKSWDPFTPCALQKGDITVFDSSGTSNTLADEYFRNNIWDYYSN